VEIIAPTVALGFKLLEYKIWSKNCGSYLGENEVKRKTGFNELKIKCEEQAVVC
jgi:hypothetical protein